MGISFKPATVRPSKVPASAAHQPRGNIALMKRYAVATVLVVGLGLLFLFRGKSEWELAASTPSQMPPAPVGLKLFAKHVKPTRPVAHAIGYQAGHIDSCRVLAAGKDFKVPTLEVSFWRAKGSPNGDYAIFYFPYEKKPEEVTVSGDLSTVISEPPLILYDSYRFGQDRSLCKFTYKTLNEYVTAKFNCPSMSEKGDHIEVTGEFVCRLQR